MSEGRPCHAGEYAENELRKDFTISERVAIAEAIAEVESEAAKGRQKRKPADSAVDSGPQQNGSKTRDITATKAGLGSGKNYERAKQVTAKGSKALIDAMDSGEVAVSTAAKLADLPKADQTKAVNRMTCGSATCCSRQASAQCRLR